MPANAYGIVVEGPYDAAVFCQLMPRILLSEARLEYTEQVCAEIARSLRLDTLSYRCPSFRTFARQVVNC